MKEKKGNGEEKGKVWVEEKRRKRQTGKVGKEDMSRNRVKVIR